MKFIVLACLGFYVAAVSPPRMVTSSKQTASGNWIPDKYSTDDDDQLMKNLIEQGLAFTKDVGFTDKYQFKTEPGCGCSPDACDCCMKKHTHFWIDRQGALDAAKEVVGVNLHMQGDKLSGYLAEHFDDTWN